MAGSHYDIIVVGGGPAGATAARRAAQGGARTLLLERCPMPRPKLCGGWVSNYALSLLDFDVPETIIEQPFNRAQLHFHASGQSYAAPGGFGVFVDRARFDAMLFERARETGVTCRFESVSGLNGELGSYEVRTEVSLHTADAIILATGANSRLTNYLRPTDASDQWAIAVEQRLPIEFADHWELEPGDAYLHFGVVEFGYAWALHHGSYLLVGVGARRDKVSDIRSVFAGLWRTWGLADGDRRCQGHPIPLGGQDRAIGRGRVLAVGDAAGTVDAFNGEGIAGAILSGRLAADALVTHPSDGAAHHYRQQLQRDLLHELRSSRRAARLFHSLPGSLIRAFCKHPQIAEKYNAVLQRQSTYSEFLRWLLRRGLWRSPAPNAKAAT